MKNWCEFREEWEDYEIAIGEAEKSDAARVASLKTVMGHQAANMSKHLNLNEDDRKTTKKSLLGLRNISSSAK